MKKKWVIFSLVILLFQFFTPLIAVAETLSTDTNSTEVASELENSNLEADVTKNEVEQTTSTTKNQEEVTSSTVVEAEVDKKTEPSADKVSSTEESTVGETTESEKKKKLADRENVDISQFLGSQSFFTSVKVLDSDGKPINGQQVELGDKLTVQFEYSIPEEVREQMQNGDYYDAQLPPEIKIVSKIKFDLEGPNGVYGTGEIGTDGKIHIVFNQKVEEESNIHGKVHVSGELQQGNLTGPGPGEIEFPFVEEGPSIPIIVKPGTDTMISKKGRPNRPTNPNEIVWDIDINLNLEKLTNANVTDAYPSGTKYKSVKVYKVKVGFDGKVIEDESTFELMQEGVDYSVDASGKVTFLKEINDGYRLEYTTEIIQDEKPGAEGGTVTYNNKAYLSYDELTGNPLEAGASVSAKYNKSLEKIAPEYDPEKQEFKWTIHYNYVEFDIPSKNAHVSDNFTSNMILKDDSFVVNKVTFNENGDPVVGEKLVEGTDYKLIPQADGKGFKIEFIGKMDYAVDISYVTKIDEEVTSTQEYKNQVTDGSGNSSHNQGQAQQQGLIKNLGEVDYHSKTLTWNIKVNMNEYELNNWQMTDQMSPGLELALGVRSFIVQDLTTGSNLEQGVDYTISYNEQTGKIDIKFIGNYQKTNHKFLITYKTKFDTAELNEAGLGKFTNTATSTWTNQDGEELTSTDGDEFEPTAEESADGFKNGSYNAKTKTITWSMGINYNRQELGDVKVTDPITSNQKFVLGSLKVFRYTISSDGKVVKGNEIVEPELSTKINYQEPTDSNNVLGINIKKMSSTDQILFEFETSLVGEVVNDSEAYHNIAEVDAESVEGNFIIEGDVSIANGGSLIQKSGKQNEDGYLEWSATINPSQSTIYDAKVTDRPSSNQVIDESTVILYEIEVGENGSLTKSTPLDKSKYTVKLTTDEVTGEQELVVNFTEEKIDKAYILEYTAMLLLENPSGEVAKNNIKLEGINKEELEQEISKEVGVSASEGGGTAVGETGSVTLKKINEDGKILTGASFELWNKKGTQKIREGKVDEKGILLFGKLPFGDYLLKEIVAPSGHNIPSDLLTGRKITVNKKTSQAGSYLEIINNASQVVLEKENEAGAKLSGAEFTLERNVDGNWQKVTTEKALVTDKDGKLVVKELTAGHYRFTETKAPEGYLLNTEPIEFDVVTTNEGQTPTVKVGPFINYLGSASFVKKDGETNKVLSGASFKIKRVKDSSGNPINEEINRVFVSNTEGLVELTNLAPGEYEVTEVKALTGYLLNKEKIKFTITNKDLGKPANIDAGNFLNYQGEFELVKKDEKGNLLVGAKFQVKDSKGQNVGPTITSDANGKVKVTGLTPGNYTIHEVEAPDGFIKNTEPTSFEIKKETTGKPETVVGKDFINYQGSIRMLKVNTGGEGLAGAEFSLFNKDDNPETATPLGVYTSDLRGRIEISNLAPGSYKLVETKAPVSSETNYIKNEYPRFFDIPEEYPGKVEQFNLGQYQNFKGKAVISKTTSEGEALKGAEFDLYILGADGTEKKVNTDGPIVSDKDGKLNISDLGAGFYKLIEVKAPEGHLINSNPIFMTVLEEDDENPLIEDNLAFKNYESTIEFEKTDDSEKLLQGATFDIYKDNGKGEKEGSPINKAPLTSSTGKYIYKGLEVGKYVLEETTGVDGYIRNTDLIPFEVKAQIGEPEPILLDSVINYQGEVELEKVDEEGNPLADAEFTIYLDDKKVTTEKSDADGLVSFKNLAPGEYIIKETKATLGFILNETEISVTIEKEASGSEGAEVINLGEFKNYKGSLSFVKKNETETKLAGSTFKLYDESGDNEVLNPETKAPIIATSSENGVVTFKELAPGNYTIKEVEATHGYLVNTHSVKVTIDETSADGKINLELDDFTNYQGSAELIKVDEKDEKKVLSGAEFKLVDAENKAIKENLTTDKIGKVIVNDLAPGTYYFIETKAPTGYILSNEKYKLVIADDAEGKPETITIKVTNEKTVDKPGPKEEGNKGNGNQTKPKDKLPQLNEIAMNLSLAIGWAFITFTLMGYYFRKNNPFGEK